MILKLNNWYRIVFILVLGSSLVANLALASNKYTNQERTAGLEKPAALGETVINIGSLHCYFTNSTI